MLLGVVNKIVLKSNILRDRKMFHIFVANICCFINFIIFSISIVSISCIYIESVWVKLQNPFFYKDDHRLIGKKWLIFPSGQGFKMSRSVILGSKEAFIVIF